MFVRKTADLLTKVDMVIVVLVVFCYGAIIGEIGYGKYLGIITGLLFAFDLLTRILVSLTYIFIFKDRSSIGLLFLEKENDIDGEQQKQETQAIAPINPTN